MTTTQREEWEDGNWVKEFDKGHNTQNISDPASDTEWVKSFIRTQIHFAEQKIEAETRLQIFEILHEKAMKTKNTHALDLIEEAQKELLCARSQTNSL